MKKDTVVSVGALAIAVALTLAGCASAGETTPTTSSAVTPTTAAPTTGPATPAATPSAEPSVTPTTPPVTAEPSPQPTDAHADFADPSTWVMTDKSVGPFTIGASFDEAAAFMADYGYVQGCAPGDGQKVLTYQNEVSNILVAAAFDESTGDRSDAIGTVEIMGDAAGSPKTDKGTGIGSVLAEIPAAYPDATVTEYGQAFSGYVVTGGEADTYFGSQQGDTVSQIVMTSQTKPPMEFCG